MKTRTMKAIHSNPPDSVGVFMCKAQFGVAHYSDIAFCLNTRTDASGDYCIVETYEDGPSD